MSITIGKPCAVCEKGGRANNEDCVFPEEEYTESGQRLFLVCDGVGGAERGEVASALACEAIRTYFDTFLGDADPTADFIQRALRYTETRFDAYLQAHPEAKGMATTLTLAYIGRQSITLAHIGDSRIYYIRHGKAPPKRLASIPNATRLPVPYRAAIAPPRRKSSAGKRCRPTTGYSFAPTGPWNRWKSPSCSPSSPRRKAPPRSRSSSWSDAPRRTATTIPSSSFHW